MVSPLLIALGRRSLASSWRIHEALKFIKTAVLFRPDGTAASILSAFPGPRMTMRTDAITGL